VSVYSLGCAHCLYFSRPWKHNNRPLQLWQGTHRHRHLCPSTFLWIFRQCRRLLTILWPSTFHMRQGSEPALSTTLLVLLRVVLLRKYQKSLSKTPCQDRNGGST
jgi:hypothetical protein